MNARYAFAALLVVAADMHSAPVRIYDRDGLWVSTLHARADLTPENLAHDIEAALR